MFANSKRRKRAKNVLAMGEIAAVSSLTPLLNQFPELDELVTETATWDFFGTVAAVGSAMYLAHKEIPQDQVRATERAVAKVLNKWDHQGYQAYLDLHQFVAPRIEQGWTIELAVGAWVMWNIKGAKPTEREFQVGAAIGSMFFVSMAGAWSS
ncbi:MAG: hypothetical protein OXU74_06915 [Gemmatimonadota bacterium]|nr:hypothetical protein [Gemmatimonadota bacterium]